MGDQIPAEPLNILDKTIDGPHKDEHTGGIQHPDKPSPIYTRTEGVWCRALIHAVVENGRRYDEKPKKEDLDDEASDNDVRTVCDAALRMAAHETRSYRQVMSRCCEDITME